MWQNALTTERQTKMKTPNTHTATLTHAVTDGTQDLGLFDSAETATAFAHQGETVEALAAPVTREDCKPTGGGFRVW